MFMKRIPYFLLMICLCAVMTTGCGGPSDASEEEERLRVCASFSTIADFCQKIGGEQIHLTTMIPSGTEAHDWEPSPGDIVRLGEADVLVINGAGLEQWTDTVLSSLNKPELVVVDTSAEIPALLGTHSHDHEGEEDHDDDAKADGIDPHTWLSPVNVKAQLQAICDALVKADPDNAGTYTKNLTHWQAEMDALDQEYQDALGGLAHKDIVVTHQAYGHLCHAYGLTQHGIEGISAESDPDPKRMAEIIQLVQEKRVRAIFYDPAHGDRVARVVADATGTEMKALYPLEGFTAQQQADGEDYVSVMRKNLQALREALS